MSPQPVLPASESFRLPNTTILVRLAQADVKLCVDTLLSAYRNAEFPERLRFSIQAQPGEDVTCVAVFRSGAARKLCAGFPVGVDFCVEALMRQVFVEQRRGAPATAEEFCLWVDSHAVFVSRWDTSALLEWGKVQNEYAVLSTVPIEASDPAFAADPYGHSFQPASEGQPVPVLCEAEIRQQAVSSTVTNGPCSLRSLQCPSLVPIWSSRFSVHRCHAEALLSPEPQLRGQDVAVAAILFAHGYDVYSPSVNLIGHSYNGPGPQHEPPWSVASDAGAPVWRQIWGPAIPGQTRSLESWMTWSGINLETADVAENNRFCQLQVEFQRQPFENPNEPLPGASDQGTPDGGPSLILGAAVVFAIAYMFIMGFHQIAARHFLRLLRPGTTYEADDEDEDDVLSTHGARNTRAVRRAVVV
mmetsp:Transcript_34299/g.74956  ORF Transcript_34299/g.74956 Transcript_34299/m.74956 type:complete len:416 (+) Transcript_34299:104-1351(+)